MKLFLLYAFVSVAFLMHGQVEYQAVFNHLDSSYFNNRTENELGVGMFIRKDGKRIYQNTVGYANREEKISFDENTRIGIASISKQFTALCIRILEFEGKLNEEDDIRTYLPELPNYSETIQIKHLLSHTSGIRDHIELLGWQQNQKEKFYTADGTLDKLNEFNQLSFLPGTDFAYSNTGYILLGEIVKRVSGKSLETFASERIFRPLGMNATEFSQFRKYKEYGKSRPYNYHRGKKKFRGLTTNEINALGATGVYTTMADLEKWDDQWRLNSLKLDSAIIQKMNSSFVLKDGRSVHYNNGQKFRTYRGHYLIEHAGGWAFYNAQYTRIPAIGISLIAASNNTYDYCIGMVEDAINHMSIDLVEDSVLTPSPEQYEGVYYSKNGIIRTVEFDSIGRLVIGGPRMIRGKADTLSLTSGICYQNQKTPELCFVTPRGGNKGFLFEGSAYFQLQRFYEQQTDSSIYHLAGNYYSKEIGKVKICYKKRTGLYYIKINKASKKPLKKYANNLFTTDRDGLMIEIHSDGIVLANKRVFNLKCIKQ